MVLRRHKVFLATALLALFAACSKDEATSTFSNRAYVYCYFNTLQYAELLNVMGNLGQYASIRKRVVNGVTSFTMANSAGTHDYPADALSKNFGLGLGGLIVGMSTAGEPMCFDLSCPNCDRAAARLTINDGYAKCASCGVTYHMDNSGAISSKPDGLELSNPRGLFRYRINFDGSNINAYN